MSYATDNVSQISAYAQINNQPQQLPLETFDVQLAAYGSIGHFSATTAISALADYGWGPDNLLGTAIDNAQPSLSDGSPSYPIKLYATGAYDVVTRLIFAGDIDELSWDFDNDELRITGRDYGGRMRDWMAVLTPSWMNMSYAGFAAAVITGVGLTPKIATSATVNDPIGSLLFAIGENNIPGYSRLGYNTAGISDEVSAFSNPRNMWELLNEVARSVGFIVTVHLDGTVYVGPPGGDSTLDLTPRTFTWFAAENTPNIVPVRKLSVDHGPRQYGTFAVRAFGFHPPSVQVIATQVMAFSGTQASFQSAALGRQQISAGVYKSSVVNQAAETGKPNYFFYLPGVKQDRLEQIAVGMAFDIARRLYIVHGEIDGDPTLVPTTPITLAESSPGQLQGYAGKTLHVASVNHTFGMSHDENGESEGFLTRFRAWYTPPAPSVPGVKNQTEKVTS